MKLLVVFLSLFLVSKAEVSWFSPEKNVTCVGHDNGDITCDPGQQAQVESVSLEQAVTPAIRGRSADPLDKRVTCGIDERLCFVHCFAIGYCNSNCDDKGICRCNCYDKSPWPLVCTKTTCS
ncbi:hypothetical protein BU24DRAFT_461071 [Aaosphaeria arxii CBS 175.79]|uniref:Invertebrate defensins family profile domain-containing protein n=1 Tax=Aaosphaeria arxii CBS 175.79 TaxID=1450172 RepID=A0A6A5XZ77_9PLEO|nr:uncharacterized protein BU24DRAFT_461071 [Aaosphaeria arxii CBS 175.79]KAF2018097.1 hypothetical protein BU24DRAFT_461071 [Aaosphaeria arxii CBS 175.79]